MGNLSASDVKTYLESIDFGSLNTLYIVRSSYIDASGKWIQSFDDVNPATAQFTFMEGSLKVQGNSYSYLLPYGKLKFIELNKEMSYIKFELVH